MSAFTAGETLLLEDTVRVQFVRYLGDTQAIVKVGTDTQITTVNRLSREG